MRMKNKFFFQIIFFVNSIFTKKMHFYWISLLKNLNWALGTYQLTLTKLNLIDFLTEHLQHIIATAKLLLIIFWSNLCVWNSGYVCLHSGSWLNVFGKNLPILREKLPKTSNFTEFLFKVWRKLFTPFADIIR